MHNNISNKSKYIRNKSRCMNDFASLMNHCFAIYKSKYCDDCELFLLEKNKSITRLREKKRHYGDT